MSDQTPPEPRSILQKAISVCAVGMGIGFGTCGLVTLTHAGEGRFWSILAGTGAALFFLSLAGLVLTFLALAFQRLREHLRK